MLRSLIIFTVIAIALIAAYFWIRVSLAPESIQPEISQPTTPILPSLAPPSLPEEMVPEGIEKPGETEEALQIKPVVVYENPVSDFALSGQGIYLFDLKEKKMKLFVDKDTVSDIFESTSPLYFRLASGKLLYWTSIARRLYDLETKKSFSLKGALAADIVPGTSNVAAHFVDSLKAINEIRLVNVERDTFRTLLTTHFQEIKLVGLDAGKILVFEKPSATVQSALYLLSFDPKNTKSAASIEPIFPEAPALDAIASGDGKFIFVSYLGSRGFLVNALINKTGKVLLRPEFGTTAQKCSFSADSSLLVCAHPLNVLNTGNFDAYLRGEVMLNSKFSVIDLKNLKPFDFGSQYFDFDAEKVAVSLTEGSLYFLNRNDKKLYSFILPTDILVEQKTVTTTLPQ